MIHIIKISLCVSVIMSFLFLLCSWDSIYFNASSVFCVLSVYEAWTLRMTSRELVWQAEEDFICLTQPRWLQTHRHLPLGTTPGNLMCIEALRACVSVVSGGIYLHIAHVQYVQTHESQASPCATRAGTSNPCSAHANMTRSLQGVRLRHGRACLTLWLQLCSIWPEMGDTASFAHFPFILIKWLPIPEDRVDTGRDC